MSRSLMLALATAALAAVSSVAASAAASPAPVRTFTHARFGAVLATQGGRALYTWTPETKDHRVHCTGSCARVWPPLLVGSARAVPRRVAGLDGSFGTIRRPGGRIQVTYNRVPLYTYVHEGPRQVLCDDVDGWFVVRA